MERRARRLRLALERLGPTFIKLGQFLSRRPDILPPQYIAQLAELQDRTRPMPLEVTRQRLEEVCICSRSGSHREQRPNCLHCEGVAKVFDAFEWEPVASASLAQVHRAVFHGKTVAVKVLKAGVIDAINLDLALLWRFRWLIGRIFGIGRNMPPSEFIAEFRNRLLEEVNLELEGLNIERFRDSHPDDGPVRTPAVDWALDRADVLVTEYVDGVPMHAWRGDTEARRRMARVIAEDFLRQVFIDNFFHADPHPGNLVVTADDRVVYLDFGATGQLDPSTRRALHRVFLAILRSDSDLAVDAVLAVGGTKPGSVDVAEFRIEVDRIIQRYRRRPGAPWTDPVVDAARRHGIRLPKGILLYARAAMLNEALVMELDPAFEILPVVQEMALPVLERELAAAARGLPQRFPELLDEFAGLLRELPAILREFSHRDRGSHGGAAPS